MPTPGPDPGGILDSLRETIVLCAIVTVVAVAVSVPIASYPRPPRSVRGVEHLGGEHQSGDPDLRHRRVARPVVVANVAGGSSHGRSSSPCSSSRSSPIYLNTYTAVRQVPGGPVDAARALGYEERHVLHPGRVRPRRVADLHRHPCRRHPGRGHRADPGLSRRRRPRTLCSRRVRAEQQHARHRWDRAHRWARCPDGVDIRAAGKTRAANRRSPTRSTTRRTTMTTSMKHRRTAVRLLAPLVALGLVATACGSDDDGDTGADTSTDVAATDVASTDADTGGEVGRRADDPPPRPGLQRGRSPSPRSTDSSSRPRATTSRS